MALNTAEHTALIPRHYDEYVSAAANPSRTDYPRALDALKAIIDGASRAHDLLTAEYLAKPKTDALPRL
jgi:hypothetical protein